MNLNPTHQTDTPLPRMNRLIGLDPSMPPGVEVGQVQMALSSLNIAIEQVCDAQQSIEIRLNPITLAIPEGGDAQGTSTPQPPVCELVEAIQRMQDKVNYLASRQKRLLQTVQL